MRSLPLLLLLACGDKEGETCVTLDDGTYDAAGSCFGMSMSTTLEMDVEDCSFTLGNWSMDHGAPTGGSVSFAEVVLEGGDFEGCTGEVSEGVISGICPDGCAWELSYAP